MVTRSFGEAGSVGEAGLVVRESHACCTGRAAWNDDHQKLQADQRKAFEKGQQTLLLQYQYHFP
ncbi:hypothetical protein HDU98_005887 [Podochytrium sp. JEL0797]|nr:hypothetical protein HDU98_005887 [Podochytrium sp. JEL0797]